MHIISIAIFLLNLIVIPIVMMIFTKKRFYYLRWQIIIFFFIWLVMNIICLMWITLKNDCTKGQHRYCIDIPVMAARLVEK